MLNNRDKKNYMENKNWKLSPEFHINNIDFKKPIIDNIRKRFSIRAFQNIPLDSDLRNEINKILNSPNFYSPFSPKTENVRFKLINYTDLDQELYSKYDTIGGIIGAQDFLVGAIEKSRYDFEHFGYLFESIILKLTELGLGTCWLGGFFDRNLFGNGVQKKSHETIPAITPVGRPDFIKILGRFGVNSNFDRIRLPKEKLFFVGDLSHPFKHSRSDIYAILLEMVHIGPSASNLQPWRIIKEINEDTFHFYILQTKDRIGLLYNNFRRIDIGIAVSHFDLTSKYLNLNGYWDYVQPEIHTGNDLKYIISWRRKA